MGTRLLCPLRWPVRCPKTETSSSRACKERTASSIPVSECVEGPDISPDSGSPQMLFAFGQQNADHLAKVNREFVIVLAGRGQSCKAGSI